MEKENKLSLIQIQDKKTNWEEAIKQGVSLLADQGIATPELTEAIIASTKEFGPYYVLMPRVALAHTQFGSYNKKVGMSLVLFKEAVKFSNADRHSVNLLFTLSAIDSESHMSLLSRFAEVLSQRDIVENALACETEEALLDIFKELF